MKASGGSEAAFVDALAASIEYQVTIGVRVRVRVRVSIRVRRGGLISEHKGMHARLSGMRFNKDGQGPSREQASRKTK